jgi:hypothetical protein
MDQAENQSSDEVGDRHNDEQDQGAHKHIA